MRMSHSYLSTHKFTYNNIFIYSFYQSQKSTLHKAIDPAIQPVGKISLDLIHAEVDTYITILLLEHILRAGTPLSLNNVSGGE